MLNVKKATIAAIAVGAITASSFAGTVDVKFTGTGLGRAVRINLNDHSSYVFAGQLKHNFSNGTGQCSSLDGNQITFCTELTEYVTRTTKQYECSPLIEAPRSNPMGPEAAQAIADLYAYADGRQFTAYASGDNKNFTSAFQIAVWEVVSDYDGTSGSLDVTAGDLTVTNYYGGNLDAGIVAYLTELFGAVGMNASTEGLFAVVNDGCQDQLVMVPLPGALMLGAAGLGLVAWRRKRLLHK